MRRAARPEAGGERPVTHRQGAGGSAPAVRRDRMPGPIGLVRRLVFGRPVPTAAGLAHRLPIYLALPVFASDALSSVAYATEEILFVLAAAWALGNAGPATGLLMPVTAAIVVLILIVVNSYRNAVHHYPTSGGSYTVAKHNLGVYPGLTAAAALAIDYVMTVAVSVSAGIAAVTSAYPVLYHYRVELALVGLGLMALVNLRGVKESGWTFALPAYGFIVAIGLVILSSVYHYLCGTIVPVPPAAGAITPIAAVSVLIVLRAFSNGCSAMTGVEAVSNGISAFAPPEARNASRTLAILAGLLVFLFAGVGFSAHVYGVLPSHTETVVSQLARANFGHGFLYSIVAYSTLAILLVAANTSFAGFPRLFSIVSADGYAPRIFTQLGDKLVFNRGIYTLTAVSAVLIVAFHASVNAMIPLYAVGVFLCFTLSQAGMARKLSVDRQRGWQASAAFSAIGAVVTGIVTAVIIQSKFIQGAWVVVVLIPVLVFVGRGIKAHYDWFSSRMRVDPREFSPLRDPAEPLTVITLLSDLNRGALQGLNCAMDIAGERPHTEVRALHVELVPEATERLRERWRRYVEPFVGKHVRLEVVQSPYRWLIPPVLDYVDRMMRERPGTRLVMVIAEFETGNPITHLLHNASARRLYAALRNKPQVMIVTSRFFIRDVGTSQPSQPGSGS